MTKIISKPPFNSFYSYVCFCVLRNEYQFTPIHVTPMLGSVIKKVTFKPNIAFGKGYFNLSFS